MNYRIVFLRPETAAIECMYSLNRENLIYTWTEEILAPS